MSKRERLRDRAWMLAAEGQATLATCDRLHVGAVIVGADKQIVSTGYNGAPPDRPHCDEIGHRLIANHCLRTIHAEMNAIQQALQKKRPTAGGTLYCTHTPCPDCATDIIRAEIARVVYKQAYGGAGFEAVARLFSEAGIVMECIEHA